MSNGITARDVSKSFSDFLETYDTFRKDNNLKEGSYSVYEILTGMTDKHGRVCRQVKHFERDDPKSDWPVAVGEALTGYLVYTTMILKKYGIDIVEAMNSELESSVKQYSEVMESEE